MANYQLTFTGAEVQTLLNILGSNNATAGYIIKANGSNSVEFGAPLTYSISISGNVITLTDSAGATSTVTLPVYNGGVT